MPQHSRALLTRALGVALLFLGTQAVVRAHDVPEEIDIQSYVTVQGSNLQVVLRVPLLAITDTNLPKDGTGYLAMPYLDPALVGLEFLGNWNQQSLGRLQRHNRRSDRQLYFLVHDRILRVDNELQLADAHRLV